MKTNQKEALSKIKEMYSTLQHPNFRHVLTESLDKYNKGDYTSCLEILSKVPNKEVIFENLVNRLKGKSVHSTLKKLASDKGVPVLTELKACLSLGTHIIIDCEQGKTESSVLLPELYERIGKLILEM
jgi:2-polyprenyl-3-methyl-5-hydroxy-6-metoxy-1,4-benzoquinol methylase